MTMAKRRPSNVAFLRPIDPKRTKVVKASQTAAENDFDRALVDLLRERRRELIAIELDARAGAEAVLSLLMLTRSERIKLTASSTRQDFRPWLV